MNLQVVQIPATNNLDPIQVFLQDLAPGKGKVIIECFGRAWTAYWGAMGEDRTVRQFFIDCDSDYLVDNLVRGLPPLMPQHRRSSEAYLKRIVEKVQMYLLMEVVNA